MTKNYFTDKQIKEIYYSEAGDSIENGAFDFYKGLFNKAVEAAIGDPVAYCRGDTVLKWKGQSVNIENMFPSPKGLLNSTPLYSVKELEN